MKKFKMVQTGSQTAFPVGGGGGKARCSKAFYLFKSLKTFVCNLFKGERSGVNRGEGCQFTHNSSLSTVHSLAFTLAETLIVMGIIGVVAALTIPNVNKNTNHARQVTKFKKTYAE
ncbi:type II secretion system protein, partial [bacterium]|nr:type II secretion system protein [bacterium]